MSPLVSGGGEDSASIQEALGQLGDIGDITSLLSTLGDNSLASTLSQPDEVGEEELEVELEVEIEE